MATWVLVSVRSRVTAAAGVAAFVVLTGTGAVLVRNQETTLTATLDERALSDARAIGRQITDGPVPTVLTGLGDEDTVAQVVTRDSRVVVASANAADLAPIAPWPEGGRSRARDIGRLPVDDAPFRAVSVLIDSSPPVAVHIAATTDDISQSVRALRSSLLVTVPPVVLLLAALTWWLVGRTLRPVESIRTEVEAIHGGALHRRVPVPRSNDEIGRLARTMNAMLDRVDEASGRQQRFVADASHELRSPLTRMRTEVEVDLSHPEGADLAATHRSILEEAIGLQALVDDLLLLARTDAEAPMARAEPVDLAEVVRDQAFRMGARSRDGTADGTVDVAVEVAPLDTAWVHGERSGLERVVANLLDNAVRHARGAVRVELSAGSAADTVELAVSDDGPGIPAADRARVFERFAQLDDSRHDGGTGLGLAIVAEIVRRHGGTVAIDPDHAAGARFVVRLPVVDRTAAPPA